MPPNETHILGANMIPLAPLRPVNKIKLGDYLAKHYTITYDKNDKPIFTLKK